MLSDIQLPDEYAKGLEGLLLKEQQTDQMGVDTEIQQKQVKIAELQAAGFRFIYPIIYGLYDATPSVTRKDGPYHGKTVFDVIVQCTARDRREAIQR